MLDWPRLFGLLLVNLYLGTRHTVSVRRRLSADLKCVDAVIQRFQDPPEEIVVCDGFEDLADHNLVAYRSGKQSLTAWCMQELIGNYVVYRKRGGKQALREEQIRLIGISTRFPQQLFESYGLKRYKDGVYKLDWAGMEVTVIVPRECVQHKRNALWAMMSWAPEQIEYGMRQFDWKLDYSVLIRGILAEFYEREEITMHSTDEFRKEARRHVLAGMSYQQRVQGVPAEDRVEGLSAEERLKGLTVEERLKGISVVDRLSDLSVYDLLKRWKGSELAAVLSIKERMSGLSRIEIEGYLDRIH